MRSLYLTLVFLPLFVFAQQSKNGIDSLKKLLLNSDDTTRVNLHNELSKQLQDISFDSSIKHANIALELAQVIKFKKGEAAAYARIGFIYKDIYSYSKAIESYNKALKIMQAINNKNGVANLNYFIAVSYQLDGRYDKAIEYYVTALKKIQELNNTEIESDILNNIGTLYYSQKDYPKALEFFFRCVQLNNKTNNKKEEASALGNIGQVYSIMDEKGGMYGSTKNMHYADSAMYYFNKDLVINRRLNNEKGIASTLGNIASVYITHKRYDLAMKNLEEAAAINLKLKEEINYVSNLRNIADIHVKEDKVKLAIEELNKALKIILLTHYKEETKLVYEQLAKAYELNKDYENAYKAHEKFALYNDSLLNEAVTQQVNDINTKYETEKKEKENQFLNQQVEIQQIQGKQQKIFLVIGSIVLLLICILTIVLFNQNKQKQKTNFQLSEKNKIIEEQHKDITDSIKYAERIQKAILPPDKFWHELLPNSFVLYKPKDILSGDFYWIEQNEEYVYFAAADCTGHGVPGSLMSLVNYNLLNKAVLEKNLVQPAAILDEVNKSLTVSLHQTYNESTVRDGMDIALCSLSKKGGRMQFAGAFNGGYIFKKDGSMCELNGDKKPVGAFIEEKISLFTNSSLEIETGDKIFIFSDGYADQFGGPKGKKLKYKKLQQYIAESLHLEMAGQKDYLEQKFNEWKGNFEQVDDVLIIGITI